METADENKVIVYLYTTGFVDRKNNHRINYANVFKTKEEILLLREIYEQKDIRDGIAYKNAFDEDIYQYHLEGTNKDGEPFNELRHEKIVKVEDGQTVIYWYYKITEKTL